MPPAGVLTLGVAAVALAGASGYAAGSSRAPDGSEAAAIKKTTYETSFLEARGAAAANSHTFAFRLARVRARQRGTAKGRADGKRDGQAEAEARAAKAEAERIAANPPMICFDKEGRTDPNGTDCNQVGPRGGGPQCPAGTVENVGGGVCVPLGPPDR